MQRSFLKNSKGFSLVEILLSLGLVAFIAVGGMSISTMGVKAKIRMEMSTSLDSINKEIKNLLSDPEVCSASMYSSGESVSAGYSVQRIYDSTAQIRFEEGNTYNSLRLDSMNLRSPSLATGTYISLPGNGFIDLVINWVPTQKFRELNPKRQVVKLWVEADTSGELLNCGSVTFNQNDLWQRSSTDVNDILYLGGSVGLGVESNDAGLVVQGTVKSTIPVTNDEVLLDPGDANGAYLDFGTDKDLAFFEEASGTRADIEVKDMDLTGELVMVGPPPACNMNNLGALRVNSTIGKMQYCGETDENTARWFSIEE